MLGPVFTFCCYLVVLSAAVAEKPVKNVVLTVDFERVLAVVRPDFLSVSLDTHLIQLNWEKLNFSSPRIQRLARNLAPAILRVGGTSADSLHFTPAVGKDAEKKKATNESTIDNVCNCIYENHSSSGEVTMNPHQWNQLHDFANEAGWTLLFDLNALERRNGSWTGENTKQLLDYVSTKTPGKIHWQLGNEPDILSHFYNRSIKADSLARDYVKLSRLVKTYKSFRKSLIVGPDVTHPSGKLNLSEPIEYLRTFLKGGADSVDVISWHHYSFDGRNAILADFLNVTHFDRFREQARLVKSEINRILGNNQKRIWLSETADGWGGGTKNISDSFFANFLWLDKLGVAAQEGIELVVKQSFYHGCYGLLNPTLDPTPVYWASVLHKRLVGKRVLNVTYSDSSAVRFYAHCGNRPKSVTMFGMNLNDFEVSITLGGLLKNQKFSVFLWTEEMLITKFKDVQKNFKRTKSFVMKPKSIAFIKLRDVATAKHC